MKLPEHYQPIMPYVVVSDPEAFISFIRDVFGAEEKLLVRTPEDRVMHAEFAINGGTIMLAESNDTWPAFPAPMYLPVENVDELYEGGVAAGANGNMPPCDQPYGRAAGFIDAWGNQWWLNAPAEQ